MTDIWPYPPDDPWCGREADPDPTDRLVRAVEKRLSADADLSQERIGVAVQYNVVILSGTVRTAGQRVAAGRHARATPEVRDVSNQLTLREPAAPDAECSR